MTTSSSERYEPLYREIEQKYTREVRKNRKLTGKVEDLEKELARAREELKAKQEKIEKLNQLLFAKQASKLRTNRPVVPVPRTRESYIRPMPEHVTEEQTLVMGTYPHCDTPVGAPVASRTRTTEDIVIQPEVVVTNWTINRYWCRTCHKQVENMVPGILPKARFGPNVLTMTVIARYRWNLPYAKVRDYLSLSFGLNISAGEVAHLLETAARLVGPKWAEIAAAVKRKISGGNRSPAHAQIHAKVMSVVETLRLEGDDFVASLQQVLSQGMTAQRT